MFEWTGILNNGYMQTAYGLTFPHPFITSNSRSLQVVYESTYIHVHVLSSDIVSDIQTSLFFVSSGNVWSQ